MNSEPRHIQWTGKTNGQLFLLAEKCLQHGAEFWNMDEGQDAKLGIDNFYSEIHDIWYLDNRTPEENARMVFLDIVATSCDCYCSIVPDHQKTEHINNLEKILNDKTKDFRRFAGIPDFTGIPSLTADNKDAIINV